MSNNIDPRKLREKIAIVPQKTVLFSGTVSENIDWGKEDATMEQIVKAAKMADAHEFVSSFPDGYETRLGTRRRQFFRRAEATNLYCKSVDQTSLIFLFWMIVRVQLMLRRKLISKEPEEIREESHLYYYRAADYLCDGCGYDRRHGSRVISLRQASMMR